MSEDPDDHEEPEPDDEEPDVPDDEEPDDELELIIGSGHLGHTGGTTCDFKIYRSSCPAGI